MRDHQWSTRRSALPVIGASHAGGTVTSEFPWSMLEGEPWMADAVCPQTDPEAFFPEKGHSTRDAKKICASCDVKAQCLEYALANQERFGIWGGLSERERRRLSRGLPVDGPRKPSRWPDEVDERIRELNGQGWPDARIAREIGRNQSAVRDHRIGMGLPFIDGRLAANQARRTSHD